MKTALFIGGVVFLVVFLVGWGLVLTLLLKPAFKTVVEFLNDKAEWIKQLSIVRNGIEVLDRYWNKWKNLPFFQFVVTSVIVLAAFFVGMLTVSLITAAIFAVFGQSIGTAVIFWVFYVGAAAIILGNVIYTFFKPNPLKK